MDFKTRFLAFTAIACATSTAHAQVPTEVCQAFDSYISTAEELGGILKGVNDTKSADAAVAPMKKAMLRLYHSHRELQKIQKLSPEQGEWIRQHYELKMRQHWGVVYEQIFRLNKHSNYESPEFSKLFHTMCMMLDQ